MSHIATAQPRAEPPHSTRLNSEQLRELSRQWRNRVDEDPEKVLRVATTLDWLATQREVPQQQSERVQRHTLLHGLATWLARLVRLSRLHPAP